MGWLVLLRISRASLPVPVGPGTPLRSFAGGLLRSNLDLGEAVLRLAPNHPFPLVCSRADLCAASSFFLVSLSLCLRSQRSVQSSMPNWALPWEGRVVEVVVRELSRSEETKDCQASMLLGYKVWLL